MPQVSIIVPVYNAASSLPRCIGSVLKQEYTDFELILMDDGSTDGSAGILDEFQKEDSRVKAVHKENTGVSDTRNKGIAMAGGRYIQFMDADDWITSNATKQLVRTAEEKKADLVVADFYRVVGEHLARKGSIDTPDPMNLQEYAERMSDSPADFYYGVLWNKLYRREIIDKWQLKMDVNVSFSEDFLFNLEYLLHCRTIAALQIPVYYYEKTDGGLVSQHTSLGRMVEMKKNVYRYYRDFYQKVYDPVAYNIARPKIARFLIDGADDGLVIPFLQARKLGSETVKPRYSDGREADIVTTGYYVNKLLEQYLNDIAMKYGLSLREAKVLFALFCADGECSVRAAADFSGLSESMVRISFTTLELRHLCIVESDSEEKETVARMSASSADLAVDLQQTIRDVISRAVYGLSEEEKKQADRLIRKIHDNLVEADG